MALSSETQPNATSPSQNWLDETLSQAQPWISKCLTKHRRCLSTIPRIIPKRLVDVGPPDGSENPHLFVPSATIFALAECQGPWIPASDTNLRYLALSYCWGETGNLITTPENIEARSTSIPWNEIPQTIKDAILVTRKLGFRYLWVDSLCIVQGPNGDWATESPKMAEIYGGAFLTISAAVSPHVHHGFGKSALKNLDNPHSRILSTAANPLYRRGWVLQEQILSRRLLAFGDLGLFWVCLEKNPKGNSHFPEFPGVSRDEIPGAREEDNIRTWLELVAEYSKRSLTVQSDKLPALSGLAKLYHESTKFDYLAGLWRQSLLGDLLWIATSYSKGTHKEPPSLYTAPSWSWASLNKRIMPHGRYGAEVIAEILDAQISLKNPLAPFGEVTGGSIVLRGPLLPISPLDESRFFVWYDDGPSFSYARENLWWMFLRTTKYQYYNGLVLEGGKGIDGTYFKRIGRFQTEMGLDREALNSRLVVFCPRAFTSPVPSSLSSLTERTSAIEVPFSQSNMSDVQPVIKNVVTEVLRENAGYLVDSAKLFAGIGLTTWSMALDQTLNVFLKGLCLGLAMCFIFIVATVLAVVLIHKE
ncbi:HET-domain-containing protein [Stipitochalara longipes BDJ]|nr:HET-domain-containing protein [Stipitochalara longipes BDJ]